MHGPPRKQVLTGMGWVLGCPRFGRVWEAVSVMWQAYKGGYVPGRYPCNMVPSGTVSLLPCTLVVDTHNPPYEQRLVGMARVVVVPGKFWVLFLVWRGLGLLA